MKTAVLERKCSSLPDTECLAHWFYQSIPDKVSSMPVTVYSYLFMAMQTIDVHPCRHISRQVVNTAGVWALTTRQQCGRDLITSSDWISGSRRGAWGLLTPRHSILQFFTFCVYTRTPWSILLWITIYFSCFTLHLYIRYLLYNSSSPATWVSSLPPPILLASSVSYQPLSLPKPPSTLNRLLICALLPPFFMLCEHN